MQIKPIRDVVVILQDKADSSKGNIMLPEQFRKKPNVGTVVAVGPGTRSRNGALTPPGFAAGARIMFDPKKSWEAKIDDDTFAVTRIGDLLGVFE